MTYRDGMMGDRGGVTIGDEAGSEKSKCESVLAYDCTPRPMLVRLHDEGEAQDGARAHTVASELP